MIVREEDRIREEEKEEGEVIAIRKRKVNIKGTISPD